MPLYLQAVLGATPLTSGLMLLPFIVTGACAGIAGGVLIHRTGRYRELIWLGTVLLCLGFGLFISFNANTSKAQAIGFLVIGGIGSGLLFEPPLIAVQSQVLQKDVATATSTLSFIRNIALTFSVILGGTVFQNSMDTQAAHLRSAGLSSDLLVLLSGKNAAANVMLGSTVDNPAWRIAIKESISWAIRNMWIMYTAFAAVGVVGSAFVSATHLSTDHTETVTGLVKEEKAIVEDV
jgi:MFS family permease